MIISYTVLACNEVKELKRLLSLLIKHKDPLDEIHVVLDSGNTTDEVIDMVHQIAISHYLYIHTNPLNKNFAEQKNFAISRCKGDYIFNIDADETISPYLIKNIRHILELNKTVDVFYVPRINIVNGLTPEYIQKWWWRVNNKGYVNFPDWQMRIHKRDDKIKWVNPVHEVLTGFTNIGYLPQDDEFCIMHIKDIERQIKQNNLYETIN